MGRKGVFTYTNKKTGKVYVGTSNSNVDQRVYNYWHKLHSGTHHNSKLQNDFNRYGSSNFQIDIVEGNCRSEAEVRAIRDKIIYQNRFNTYNNLDANVSFKGGNPNASFGRGNDKRNSIINELNDIIDRTSISPYDKQNIKRRVSSGSIQNKSELNQLIKTYQPPKGGRNDKILAEYHNRAKKEMLNNVKNSNIDEETKNLLIYKIKDGKFTKWNKDELNQITNDFEGYLKKQKYSNDILMDIQINSPLENSNTGKTIKELLIELQKLNVISYWKRDYWKIVFDIGTLEYKKLYLLEKMLMGIKKDMDTFVMKDKKLILDSKPSGGKFNKTIRSLANDYCKISSLSCWTFLNKYCIIFYKFSNIEEIHSITTLVNLMNNEYINFLPENKPHWLSLNRAYWDRTKARLEKNEDLECNHTNKKITKNKCENCGYILEQEKCPYCYNKEEQNDTKKQKKEILYDVKVKQLIKFVDNFKSNINNELKEEMIKDIKDGKITNKTQISKKAMKASTNKNIDKYENKIGNKSKKNIVDFGKKKKKKKKNNSKMKD